MGTTLLNVIEGGKKKRIKNPSRTVELGSILQAVPDAAFLLDHQGSIIRVNQAAERLVGSGRHALLGRDIGELFSEKLERASELQTILGRVRAGETVRTGQMVFQCTSGDSMRVTLSASPVRDQHGAVGAVLVMLQDVTELAALQKSSETNERHVAVGQMTAGLVHDFNNVLNTINEAVTVLETQERRSEHDQAVLNIIGTAVQHGVETIRNTREYLVGSRERPRRIDVRRLLEDVLELTHPLLNTHANVTVVRQLQDCGFVNGNIDELRRAFTNLVINALDAMPQGGTLTVACSNTEEHVVVSLKDTGIGIPFEAQKRIFSPYYTTKSKGTGLGLAGARRAIQAQGGEIRFESSPGAGTTFYVRLPVADPVEHRTPSAA